MRNISLQDYNFQGEQNVNFKNQFPLISCYLQGSSVYSSFVVDVT